LAFIAVHFLRSYDKSIMDDDDYSPDPPALAMRRKLLQSKNRPKDIYAAHSAAYIEEYGVNAFWRAQEASLERETRRRFQIEATRK
jgi:hypothetical protein